MLKVPYFYKGPYFDNPIKFPMIINLYLVWNKIMNHSSNTYGDSIPPVNNVSARSVPPNATKPLNYWECTW